MGQIALSEACALVSLVLLLFFFFFFCTCSKNKNRFFKDSFFQLIQSIVAAKGNHALLNKSFIFVGNIIPVRVGGYGPNIFFTQTNICNFLVIYEDNISMTEIYTCSYLWPVRMLTKTQFISISREDTLNKTQNFQLAVVAVTGPGAI